MVVTQKKMLTSESDLSETEDEDFECVDFNGFLYGVGCSIFFGDGVNFISVLDGRLISSYIRRVCPLDFDGDSD